MIAIRHQFHIAAPREAVFKALTTIAGLSNWWTTETSGSTATGGVIDFRFGPVWKNSMKVNEQQENSLLDWECVEGANDWLGTHITFRLDENEGKTRVNFEHSGWNEANEFFASCNFSWARYLESLRQYCQTGNGEAFGSAGYRK